MTGEVLISIKGMQTLETSGEDPVEVVTAAKYLQKDGKHYISYEEVMEGMDGKIQNLIKLKDDGLEVTKRGLTNVHMVFEQNKKNMTYYDTPFGNLLIGISATNIHVDTSDDNIDVKVDYALEVNYEHLADCCINMNIKSMDNKSFQLMGN
ncbi:DUF1934 domain-containing protein [uncultured Robinsoniella sp.]|uniref:DUF1934 domain-containing protein n=1 Tax=uncultured Robinsoniella sp. TaxID=904190 RepID=UPI00374E4EA0